MVKTLCKLDRYKNSLKKLRDQQILLGDTKSFVLNDLNEKVQVVKKVRGTAVTVRNNPILQWAKGKYLRYGNKLIPLANKTARDAIREYISYKLVPDEELLNAIKFYYEDTKEKNTFKGKVYYVMAKSIKNLLEDDDLMETLLDNEQEIKNEQIESSQYTDL